MYLFYQNEEAQIQVVIPEKSFIGATEVDFSKIVEIFNSFENRNLKIYPQTKKEGEWMLRAYCELVSSEQTLPGWLLNHFHMSFSQILAGAPVAKALRLVRAAHRPPESYVAERNERIYMDVIDLMKKGVPLFNAALELAEKYELHESNIQKIYSAIKKTKAESENSGEDIDLPF